MSGLNALIPSYVLSFKDGIDLHEGPDSNITLRFPGGESSLRSLSPGPLAALRTLSSDGATVEHLFEIVTQHEGTDGLPRFLSYLDRFRTSGLLCQTVTWSGGKLATLIPVSSAYQEGLRESPESARYVLSDFAYLHKEGEHFVLESPLAHAKIVLHDWRATVLVHTCAVSHSLEALAGMFQDLPADVTSAFVHLLLNCRMLSSVSQDGQPTQEEQVLSQWEFHDLLFHTRSRLGRHDKPLGATFRFLGRLEPRPAVEPLNDNDSICLYKPDIERLQKNDVPFTHVLEHRQSIRQHGNEPITLKELGEFLYRAARVRAYPVETQGVQGSYERSNRPYPSGGGCYELEAYVVANQCVGLSSGLYHYCPKTHRLSLLAGRTQAIETLLERAYYASEEQGMPQVLIILAARFQRVSWKYESMAYALILKHVGVLYQTMYLVATAMGLAACAIGSGDSDLFAAAAGTDYYAETSVGEFMLGSRTRDS